MLRAQAGAISAVPHSLRCPTSHALLPLCKLLFLLSRSQKCVILVLTVMSIRSKNKIFPYSVFSTTRKGCDHALPIGHTDLLPPHPLNPIICVIHFVCRVGPPAQVHQLAKDPLLATASSKAGANAFKGAPLSEQKVHYYAFFKDLNVLNNIGRRPSQRVSSVYSAVVCTWGQGCWLVHLCSPDVMSGP